MLSKSLSVAAVALSTLVSAQTSTLCNPLEKSCPHDPAFGKAGSVCDFTKGKCDDFSAADGTTLSYNGNGAVFSIKSEKEAPTASTGKYIFFGRVDIEVQAAPGKGIVTSAVLQSDDLDEIDLEWVGGDNANVQSNYFSKGQTETYDRGATHPVDNPCGSFHTYSVEWTPDAVQWIIDGTTVRTLKASEAHGVDGFPQTPMQVKLGTWVAGAKGKPEGTVQWAGGYANWDDAPFNAYYKKVTIVDYAGKSGPTSESVKEYYYGDHTGNWQSIKVVGGSGSDDSSSSSSAAASTSHSKTHSSAAPTKTHESSSAAPTSTKESKTSSAEKTTITTVASSASTPASDSSEPTSTGSGSGSGSDSGSGSATTSSGAIATPTGNAAVQNGAAFGLAAGVALLAQLL